MPPLNPVAPDRAAITSRLALLLPNNRRAMLLKTLSSSRAPSSRPATSSSKSVAAAYNNDDDHDLFGGPPNEGVGYVRDAKAASDAATTRETQALRQRMLGRRGAAASSAKRKAAAADSDSDEDEGRSALGKRKKTSRVEDTAESARRNGGTSVDNDGVGGDGDTEEVETSLAEIGSAVSPLNEEPQTSGSKKKKKKKKKRKQTNGS